jgi:CubicO group peptidase (beta-lactamase class C family)
MEAYDGAVPGASVAVIRNGEPLIRRSWGLADLEAGTAASSATNYRLASVSKQFTAAAILLLVQDGMLGLDDVIGEWLPSLVERVRRVTVRQLLTHTSGIADYEDLVPPRATRQVRDADVPGLLASSDTSYFEPGSGYRYSNSGYALLALVVERASGMSFRTFLRERIFLPLSMHTSVAYEEGVSSVENRAYGYSLVRGSWKRNDQSITSAVLGDGGIYSSIDDLVKWDAALYDDRLLGAEYRRLAFTPHTATDDPDVRYGFGWRITGDAVWHSGETVGFRNVIVRCPARRTTAIILTNRDYPEENAGKGIRLAAFSLVEPSILTGGQN